MANNPFKNINYSVLDLAVICAGDTLHQTFKKSLQAAQHAEKAGYTRYWFSEHHNMESVASAATSLLIAYVAQGTSSIRAGSGGIMLPNHSPLIIAEQFGTLGAMYPGRIDLGLGRAPGTDGLTAMTIRQSPINAPYDFKAAIKELQRYFSIENAGAKVRAIPGEGVDVPLWVLGSSTDSAYLAAELGLPYAFAAHFAPAQLDRALQIYRTNFQPSPALKEPYTLACINVITAGTNEEAEFLSTSLYKMFMGIFTQSRSPLQPPVNYAELQTQIPPELKYGIDHMLACTFVGDKEKVAADLKTFIRSTQINELMVTSYIYDQEKRLNNYTLVSEILTD